MSKQSKVRQRKHESSSTQASKTMNWLDASPIDYFNRWLAEPIRVAGDADVESILDALNRHPLAQDETACNYFMPPHRYREKFGRFQIYGENQDTWNCFVYDGEQSRCDPPVYFETCLDLELDYGFNRANILDGDHVLVCDRFTSFLWQMLGEQICIRLEDNGKFSKEVHGVAFELPPKIDNSFVNPLGREFPSGFTCYFSPDTICIPDFGAAFLDAESGRRFLAKFSPVVSRQWP